MATPVSCMEVAVPSSMDASVLFSPRMYLRCFSLCGGFDVVSSFGVGELSAINGLAGGMHFRRTIQSFSVP
jgi:hypothetical protein